MAEGIEGNEDSVLRLARERGFDVCPVCLELVIYDGAVTVCGHKFCVSCLQECARRSSSGSFLWPVCKTLCEGRPLLCRDLFREVRQFTCPGEKCDKKSMALADFEEHIWYSCPSREVECKCGATLFASAYTAHCEKRHPSIETPRSRCKSCGKQDLSSLLEMHEQVCRLICCPSCSLFFRNDKWPAHSGQCVVENYVCQFPGCGYRAEIGELYFHIAATHRPKIFRDVGIYRDTEPQLLFLSASRFAEISLAYVFFESPCESIKKVRLLGHGEEEWISFFSPRILDTTKVLKKLRTGSRHVVEAVTVPVLNDYAIRKSMASGMLCEEDVILLVALEEISRNFPLLMDDPADFREALAYTLGHADSLLRSVEGRD